MTTRGEWQMGRNLGRVAALAVVYSCGVGCMTTPDARYVYQDGQFGVIGIPRNTSLGKKDYREQAHELMIKHFPEGYEIVRAEEVVEGERTRDTAQKLELDSEPGVAALNQMIKVGKFAKSTSLDQKDTIKITESRIIYRRKPDGKSTGNDGFTALADLSPAFYIDPNQIAREERKNGTLLAKKDGAAKPDDKKLADAKTKDNKDAKADPGVQKTGGAETK
jgi:Zn-dependent metalloprotease